MSRLFSRSSVIAIISLIIFCCFLSADNSSLVGKWKMEMQGQIYYFTLPSGISGGSPIGMISIDYSPDGRYIVFSATIDDNPGAGPTLVVLDTQTGNYSALEAAGSAFSPVWKGR